jgi:hypothetical protein
VNSARGFRYWLSCAMLAALSAFGGQRDSGLVPAVVSPAIPAKAQEIANPFRAKCPRTSAVSTLTR